MASISPRWVGRVYSSVDFDVNHYEIKIEEEYTEGAQQTQERAAPSRLCMLHDNTLLEVSLNSTKSGRRQTGIVGLSHSVCQCSFHHLLLIEVAKFFDRHCVK